MNTAILRHFNIIEIFRYSIYIAFFLLSVRLVYVSFIAPAEIAIILGMIGLSIAIMTWWNVAYSLFGFLAAIPLVSGLKQTGLMQSTSLLSFCFAIIYISWLTKIFLKNKERISSDEIVSNIVDILSGIVLISLIFLYIEFPLGVVLYRIFHVPFIDAQYGLYGLEAGYILLQGLFFFRMLELEINDYKSWRIIIWIFCIHALIITLFSGAQFILNVPKLHFNTFGVHSPFEDVHSFGSYIVFIFFLFWGLSQHRDNPNHIAFKLLVCIFIIFIILSYSRATWLAFLIVGAVSLFYQFKKKYFFIGFSVIIAVILFANIHQATFLKSDNPYYRRLGRLIVFDNYDVDRNIVNRIRLWNRALAMMRDYPLTGRGIGTYFSRSPQYVDDSHVKVSKANKNTHNYYLQFGSELGIPALILFLSILFCTFKMGITAVLQKNENEHLVKGLFMGLSAYLITMITGHPLLLSNQQFLFWFVIAAITIIYRRSVRRPVIGIFSKYSKVLVSSLALVMIVGYTDKIFGTHYDLKRIDYGLHDVEDWSGEKMRWSMRMSRQSLLADSNIIGLRVFAPSENIHKNGLEFKLLLNDESLDQIHFNRSSHKLLYYYIPALKGKEIEITTDVDKSINAYKLGQGEDRRDLAVALSPITFLKIMPKGGIGFYNWEKWDGELLSEWPRNNPIPVRWTGRQASINTQSELTNGGTVFLKCAHQNIKNKSVNIKVFIDDNLLFVNEFEDHSWQKIIIKPDKVKNTKALTFIVSRTWNPKLYGISSDGRDLGVAVAVLGN